MRRAIVETRRLAGEPPGAIAISPTVYQLYEDRAERLDRHRARKARRAERMRARKRHGRR